MKLSKILLSAALFTATLPAVAQQEVTEYKFIPHWFLQGQIGAQETLGEGAFGKLFAPNAQIAAGYKFNPYIGARLAINGWQSKGVMDLEKKYNWKWTYVAPTADFLFDMTNVLGGYDPTRLVDVNVIAGIGVNVGFDNKEANAFAASYASQFNYQPLGLLWTGTKARFVTKFGVDVNFNITDNFALGLELQANVLPDGYNSKKAGNADWYFNGLVGARFTLGKKYTKTTRVIEPTIVEKIVEVPVEKIVERIVEVEKAKTENKIDIFFTISKSTVNSNEMSKIKELAQYLKDNPSKNVEITGYADKGTGTLRINLRLANQRAQRVARILREDYNIAASRITIKSMGEAEFQPYDEAAQNRVAICITD